jgi:hypothetical protein
LPNDRLSKIELPTSLLAAQVDFAPAKFFSFSREAKFGEFRPSALAQVVC